MKTEKTSKSKPAREIIRFNKTSFDAAVRSHALFTSAADSLIAQIKSYGAEMSVKECLRAKSIFDTVVKMVFIANTKDTNLPATIDKAKFLGLMNIDLSPLQSAVDKFEAVSEYSADPVKQDFNSYATTVSEIARVKEDKRMLVVLNELLEKGIATNPLMLNRALGSHFLIGDDNKLEVR